MFPRILLLACFLFIVSDTGWTQGLSPGSPAKDYIRFNGQVVAIEMAQTCIYSFSQSSASFPANGGSGVFEFSANYPACPQGVSSNANWISVTGSANGVLTYNVAANQSSSARQGVITVGPQVFTVFQAGATVTPPPSGLHFVAIAPCRLVDTRNSSGPFGGPYLAGQTSRDFLVPNGGCGVPSSAQAYSLNVTVIAPGGLGYLTVWPTGQNQPGTSTMNSTDGRTKGNAVIVAAGKGGGVSVFASNDTDLALDINGYFVPDPNQMSFFPVASCRVLDTRNSGPYLAGNTSRDFAITGGPCNLPTNAQAYLLNLTVVPHANLEYITAWSSGQSQPNTSTLNAHTGVVTANAAILAAGTNGLISVFASNDTDLIIDVNGYFASAPNGLSFYPTASCRVIDTRYSESGQPFSGTLPVNVGSSGCGVPSSAQAYLLNATLDPPSGVGYVSIWPDGQAQPNTSLLDSVDGIVTSNLAIVPNGNGSIDVFASNPAQLILDVSGYFAP